MEQNNTRKTVLCPLERSGGKTYWMRIGSAFINRDGSLNVYLDALPSNNRLQIREPSERDLEQVKPVAAAEEAKPVAVEKVADDLPF